MAKELTVVGLREALKDFPPSAVTEITSLKGLDKDGKRPTREESDKVVRVILTK